MSRTPLEKPGREAAGPAPAERRNVRGVATRQRMLDAAERLFAERGIEAVPLRDISLAAGQRNHTAVRYHFGNRDQIVKAIMETRGAESEASRAGIVAEMMLGTTAATVADVVGAFVRPLAIHLQPQNHYLAFLSRLITEEGGYEGLEGVNAGASVITLRTLLGRLAPNVPEAVLDERWWLTLTSTVHALARYQSAREHAHLPAKMDVLIDDLIAYLSAGLIAPVVAGDPRV